MLFVNFIVISTIFVLNYFYQRNGFDFTLKCVCSAGFALLGAVDLVYACVRLVYWTLELDRSRMHGNLLSRTLLFSTLYVLENSK